VTTISQFTKIYGVGKGYRSVLAAWWHFCNFDRTLACDRRTDRQT